LQQRILGLQRASQEFPQRRNSGYCTKSSQSKHMRGLGRQSLEHQSEEEPIDQDDERIERQRNGWT
jgi:hypothetical protein